MDRNQLDAVVFELLAEIDGPDPGLALAAARTLDAAVAAGSDLSEHAERLLALGDAPGAARGAAARSWVARAVARHVLRSGDGALARAALAAGGATAAALADLVGEVAVAPALMEVFAASADTSPEGSMRYLQAVLGQVRAGGSVTEHLPRLVGGLSSLGPPAFRGGPSLGWGALLRIPSAAAPVEAALRGAIAAGGPAAWHAARILVPHLVLGGRSAELDPWRARRELRTAVATGCCSAAYTLAQEEGTPGAAALLQLLDALGAEVPATWRGHLQKARAFLSARVR